MASMIRPVGTAREKKFYVIKLDGMKPTPPLVRKEIWNGIWKLETIAESAPGYGVVYAMPRGQEKGFANIFANWHFSDETEVEGEELELVVLKISPSLLIPVLEKEAPQP